jgi:alpha-1,2-mannosyltransferase
MPNLSQTDWGSRISGAWLTSRRLRTHGVILSLVLWSLYIWTLWTPGLRDSNWNFKGTDFLHFYTLGLIANTHRGDLLYDTNAQASLSVMNVEDAAGIRYLPLYPPQVSLLFRPFAVLPYAWALACWWVCCAILYGACCYLIWRACPNLEEFGSIIFILAWAFPGFFNLIAWGQTSTVALAYFTAMFFLLRARLHFWTGVALGCLIFKPQLGVAAVILFLGIGAWRVIAGAVLSSALQILVGVLYYGWGPARQWIIMLGNAFSTPLSFEPRPYQTHSLRTFWSMLVPSTSFASLLYAASAIVILGWTILLWRRSASLPLRFSALLLATVLVSPHLTVYDLVILAPMFLLISDWLIEQSKVTAIRWIGPLLYLVYVLPLLGPLARWTHVQPSVIAMAALVFVIFRIPRKVRA